MATKKDPLRQINIKPAIKGGGSLITSAQEVAPPALGTIPAPTGLTFTNSTIARSTQASMAYINIRWNPPSNITPEYYDIEYGKVSDFSGGALNNPIRVRSYNTSAALLADADTAYKVRVRAVYRTTVSKWTAYIDVVTAEDDIPPADFDIYSAEFQNGNLVLTYGYIGPTPENFKEARIQIYNADKSILYADFRSSGGHYIWTEAQNLKATNNVGLTDVSVDFTPVSWTNFQGNTVNDTATSVAPDAISSLAYDFTTGDLNLSWTNPTNAPFKLIRVSIYDDNTAPSPYRTVDVLGTNFTWTVDNNFADTGNNPDPSVYVTVQVIGWLNQASSVVNTTATKALPAAPIAVYTSWDGDTGTADENVVISWDSVPYALNYELTINGVSLDVTDNTYTYTYSENVGDNGTPGDPSLTIEVKTRDRLLQLSASPAVNNAVNAAPSDTFFTLDVVPGFSSVGAIVTLNTTIHDFKGIHWTIKDDTSAIIEEREGIDPVATFLDLDSGDYTIEAYLVDLFEQGSDPIVSAPFNVDALTIEELRQGLRYTDRPGNTEVTLNVLKGDNFGSYVSYENSYNPDYNWTQAEWPLLERIRTISLMLDDDTDHPSFYIALSADGTTWRYFAGPMMGQYLTEAADEAAAQSAAVLHSAINNERVDLPEVVEARFVKVFHKTPVLGGLYKMYKFFPRRLVQTDDLEVEAVKAINIGAGQINAGHISVTSLSAITTVTGTLTVNDGGYLRSGMTAWNTGTGYYFDNSGGTARFMVGSPTTRMYWNGTNLIVEGAALVIRTATSGNRVQIDSNGLYGYNSSGVEQVRIQSSDGKLVAGGGYTILDNNGMYIISGITSDTFRQYKFYNNSSQLISYYESFSDVDGHVNTQLVSLAPSGKLADTYIRSQADGSGYGRVNLTASGNSRSVALRIDATFERAVYITTDTIKIRGGGGITDRVAITDINDGWLRLNNSGDYSNGVYTLGVFRTNSEGQFGSSGATRIGVSGSYSALWRNNDQYAVMWREDHTLINSRGNSFISFRDDNIERAQLNSTGLTLTGSLTVGNNIVVNGSSIILDRAGNTVLHVRNSVNDNNLILYTGGASGRTDIWSRNYANSAYIPMFLGTTALGVGGAPAPSQRVRIYTGGDNSSFYPLLVADTSGSNALFYVRSATSTTVTGFIAAASWLYSSDENLKEDITDLPSQKDRLKLLKPKRFKYKGESKYSLGFTAQDMQQVFPELVEEAQVEGKTVLGIRTGELIPLLVCEIIELRDEVEALKKGNKK